MGGFSRVRTPNKVGLRYTPRRRRSLAGRLFESLIVGLIIVFGLVAWITVWACIVAAPWVLLITILHFGFGLF